MAHVQKPYFVLWRKGRIHLIRQRSQYSRLLAAEVCASAVVMLDTPCSEVVWRVLAIHSICQFPLHFPSSVSTCAITFQLDSTVSNFKVQTFLQIYVIFINEQPQDNKITYKADTDVFIPHRLLYANTEYLDGTQQLVLWVRWQVIQLQDVMDTWNWDTPPPHAVPAICHVSEQTVTILCFVNRATVYNLVKNSN